MKSSISQVRGWQWQNHARRSYRTIAQECGELVMIGFGLAKERDQIDRCPQEILLRQGQTRVLLSDCHYSRAKSSDLTN
jgi:hypothetical protein